MKKSPLLFFFWTEAEVIKSFPVILELRKQKIFPYILGSGQNNIEKSTIVQDFSLYPDIVLNQFTGRKKPLFVILWFFQTFFWKFFIFRKFVRKEQIRYIIVHGDTLTTLMGAVFARLCGLEVWHLEWWLRSFHWLKPFPEEIDRFIVGHLARVHFCQNEQAMKNVEKHKWDKIFTEGNVIYDVVDIFSNTAHVDLIDIGEDFGLFTFHRAESLYRSKNLEVILETLDLLSKNNRIVFVLFEATREVLEENWLLEKIYNNKNLIIRPRLPYAEFCFLMKKAKFIVTDGGSNQEELAHIGNPTLIMRGETERTDGIWKNIIISKFDKTIIQDFSENFQKYDFSGEDQGSPTKIIVHFIIKRLHDKK